MPTRQVVLPRQVVMPQGLGASHPAQPGHPHVSPSTLQQLAPLTAAGLFPLQLASLRRMPDCGGAQPAVFA